MEKSALVYIILTAVTVTFGFLVKNRDYTTEYLSGRRSFRGNTSGDLMAAGPDRQQACNAVAEFAIFWPGFLPAALLWAVITGSTG